MARSKSSADKNTSEPPPPPPTWDERIIQRMIPWRVELGGAALFFLFLLTFFGLAGWIQSGWLHWWTGLWREFAGWGAYVFSLSLALFGLHILFRGVSRPYRIQASQVLGFELLVLAALPITYQLSGATLATTAVGEGGGRLGWGLAVPLLDLFGPILTNTLYIFLAAVGVTLMAQITWADFLRALRALARRLRTWANQLEAEPAADRPAAPAPAAPVPRPAQAETDLIIVDNSAVPLGDVPQNRPDALPALDLLREGVVLAMSDAEIDEKKQIIERTLIDFRLAGTVTEVRRGPAVTQFGVTPGYLDRNGPDGQPKQFKVRVNQIAALKNDLALALAVPRLRIEAPVPGRGIVGVEVPNAETAAVRLRSVITAEAFQKVSGPLAVCLGLDVSGTPQATDLGKMPHLLIAGTTGSGKSVFINALISCLIFNNMPEKLKLIMIDPKKVELIRFNGLPHLLGKVEVEHERVIGVLQWLTSEMDQRYQSFAEVGAKDLRSYNRAIKKYKDVKPLPHIAVFIDELADLMAIYAADVERTLCRLAQMARATGIHLVVATQRPSTDVITGLIKANFPARCSFAVASNMDSRVILDTIGAESLLGRGDMLFLPPDASSPRRIQGCFVSDDEIDALVNHWLAYKRDVVDMAADDSAPWERVIARQNLIESTDDMLEQAVALAQKYDTISTSLLQRRLRVGFPRAARIMETLYEMGLVEHPKNGGKTRRTLVEDDGDDPLAGLLD